MERYVVTINAKTKTIKTIVAANTVSDARLMGLKNARSMFTKSERSELAPFMVAEVKEIEL